jgi:hypothetical protein
MALAPLTLQELATVGVVAVAINRVAAAAQRTGNKAADGKA